MKQSEFRIIVFALSYLHSTIVERKKFGVGNLPRATSGTTSHPMELLQIRIVLVNAHLGHVHDDASRPDCRGCLDVLQALAGT